MFVHSTFCFLGTLMLPETYQQKKSRKLDSKVLNTCSCNIKTCCKWLRTAVTDPKYENVGSGPAPPPLLPYGLLGWSDKTDTRKRAGNYYQTGTDNQSSPSPEPCISAVSDGVTESRELTPSNVPPLIESDPLVAYIYIIIMCTALMIGSFGNVLVLLVMTLIRGTQRTGKAFIINLALADLCVAGIADPMCVTAVIKGEGWFNDKWWLCEAVASMCLTACFCAFLSLTMATVNRYVFICHNNWYERIFTKGTCVAACVGSWIVAFMFELPNYVGWGGHYFDKKNHQCIWNRTASFSYTLVVSAGLIGSPLAFMCLSHILIFRRIYRTKTSLYVFEEKDPTSKRKLWLEILRTSRMLLGIFCVFVVCWTPYSVIIVLDFSKRLSVEAHLFVTMLAHMHSSCNCIVYFVINPAFRKGVFRVLGLSKCVTSDAASSAIFSESRSTDIAKISDSKSFVSHTTVSATSSVSSQ